MTVVSDRLVKNDQYLDQDIQMTGVNGITMFRPKARVWIHVGSFAISQEIAVVKDLPDEVILGLDLGETFDELLLKYMSEEKKKVVEVCEYRKVYPNDVTNVEGDLAGLQNEEGKSDCEGKERKMEEVKVTRGQRKSEEEHEKEIEKTENEEGVSVISPGSLKEGKYDIVEESEENMHDDILGNIQLEEEKDENLQTAKGEVDFTLPILNEVEGEREKFVEKIQTDESLQKIRAFAERGYFWDDGLLKQSKTDQTGLVTNRLVVPRGKRSRIMTLAQDI